jgi:Rrf2 family transcriptional regulator, iron-sulfur cluster assembly transcription factor
MKITAMQEYGLRCLLQLASQGPETPLTVREIAERESLTTMYVAKILVTLRKGGLVKSIRGVKGGYALSRAPREISVADSLSALGRMELGKDLCQRFTGTASVCTHMDNCGIRPVWGVLTQYIYGFLSQLNLEQLAQDETMVSQQVQRVQMRTPSMPVPATL